MVAAGSNRRGRGTSFILHAGQFDCYARPQLGCILKTRPGTHLLQGTIISCRHGTNIFGTGQSSRCKLQLGLLLKLCGLVCAQGLQCSPENLLHFFWRGCRQRLCQSGGPNSPGPAGLQHGPHMHEHCHPAHVPGVWLACGGAGAPAVHSASLYNCVDRLLAGNCTGWRTGARQPPAPCVGKHRQHA